MSIKKNGLMAVLLWCAMGQGFAICIDNKTDFTMHYEIDNKNMGRCAPKIKHYSGEVSPQQKRCFAHSREEGSDWQIYRFDVVTMTKVSPPGTNQLACRRKVNGILNFVEVIYHDFSNKWWCLDSSDYED